MSEQDATQASPLQRPPDDDQEAWKAYWKAQGQPWRSEPEIDVERQKYLDERRAVPPDIDKGSYPFGGTRLTRADIEWLLATHEQGRGPVEWNEMSQRKRAGLDLRGADFSQEDLSNLPLACMRGGLALSEWHQATEEQREMAAVHMQKANLDRIQLQGADLVEAQLQKASLWDVQLQNASLWRTQLQGADLVRTQLQGADLTEARLQEARLLKAQLQGADLHGTQLQGANFSQAQLQGVELVEAELDGVNLRGATLSDKQYGSVQLADVSWGEINLAVVDWGQVTRLGDEEVARQERDREGRIKDKQRRGDEYKVAVRANRQLSMVLRVQGLNEEADHFAYRAQVLQRVLWRRQGSVGKYAFSWLLAVVAGYGYKPFRCFVIYVLAVLGFTLAHYLVGAVAGPPLTLLNTLAISVQSLHGRLFSFQSSDPQTVLNTIEAFIGLLIEAIVVAVITQRILGK